MRASVGQNWLGQLLTPLPSSDSVQDERNRSILYLGEHVESPRLTLAKKATASTKQLRTKICASPGSVLNTP